MDKSEQFQTRKSRLELYRFKSKTELFLVSLLVGKSINDRIGKFNERVKALEGQMDGQNTRIQLAEDAIKNQGSRLIEFEGRIMNLERTSELMEKKQLEYSVVLSGLDFFQPTIKEIIRPKDPNGRLSLVEKIAIYLEAKEIDVQYCEIKDAQQINDT